jgi:hypothetical protein
MEDQADRVGLRYTYEAGYDVTKGPLLWKKFAEKYGEGSSALNFFFSDHSQAGERAANLETEIARNYRDGPKPDGPARREAAPEPRPAPVPVATQAPAEAPSAGGAVVTEVRLGMSPDEVKGVLGDPDSALVFGERLRWAYPDRTVIFEDGVVSEVRE